jgi:hypothetical protein
LIDAMRRRNTTDNNIRNGANWRGTTIQVLTPAPPPPPPPPPSPRFPSTAGDWRGSLDGCTCSRARVSVAGVLRGDIYVSELRFEVASNLSIYGVTHPCEAPACSPYVFFFCFPNPILFSPLVRRVIWPRIVQAGNS